MATKAQNRTVVGMPSFTDPGNPRAASGSVNFTLDEHPVDHAKLYGNMKRGKTTVAEVPSALTPPEVPTDPGAQQPQLPGSQGTESEVDPRADWTKAQWKDQAAKYDLSTSGNKQVLNERVTTYEASQKEEDGNGPEDQ